MIDKAAFFYHGAVDERDAHIFGARVGIGALLVDLADDDECAFGVAATEVRGIHAQLAQGVGGGL